MKLILIDPKQLELALYSKLPHLLMPVVTEPKMAANALLWACQEMERRYSIMAEFGVRNLEGFNHKLKIRLIALDKIKNSTIILLKKAMSCPTSSLLSMSLQTSC